MTKTRLTAKNIETQRTTAEAGTLVHWIGTTTCERKVNKTDVRKEGNLTHLAEAVWYGNITCLGCRKEAWAAGVR